MYVPPAGRLDALAAELRGRLIRPQDPDWDAARTAWQLSVDQRPAAVVQAACTEDVVATVRAARHLGLRVAPQGTGHNASPLGSLEHSILLRTDQLTDVEIDPVARTARVGAGALWGQVTGAAAKHGLAGLAGTAADVGVIGYTLGGGLSWLARQYGLAANQVTSADVVTADGVLVRADENQHPELFWALRGGGGSFGVVTALEFRLFPVTEVHAGMLAWPLERAPELLSAWRQWTGSVPEEVTSLARLLRLPPMPELPEPLRGRALFAIEAVCALDAEAVDQLLLPLRDLGPELDTFRRTEVSDLHALHMDPPGPVPGVGDGFLLWGLPPDALAALLDLAGPERDVPLLSIELRHLGGALQPGRVSGGAVSGLNAEFAIFSVGITPDAASAAAVRTVLDDVHKALAPWEPETGYRNFAERQRSSFDGDAVRQRLREIKADYDPDDLVHANHPVVPAQ